MNLESIDYLCGEGSEVERAAFREELESDLAVTLDFAETRMLVEDLRELRVRPSGQLGPRLRGIVLRRSRLRGTGSAGAGGIGWKVAAAAALWLGLGYALFGGREAVAPNDGELVAAADAAALPFHSDQWPVAVSPSMSDGDAELGALLDPRHLPVADPEFLTALRSVDRTAVDDTFRGWLSAENQLALLRRLDRARRAGATAAISDIDARAQQLAGRLAGRLQDGQAVELDGLAYGLRALLAAGPGDQPASRRMAIARCGDELAAAVTDLEGGELALALAALTELAVAGDQAMAALVGEQAERLARDTLRRREDGARPALLHWGTSAARLAEAGRVLDLAPAFGCHAGLALRARALMTAHLGERLAQRSSTESPALVAAWLYGFGDLIDRREADRRLRLWRPRLLLPDYVALQQLAWSKYPVRRGWAAFQRDLRGVAGLPTPGATLDMAALLLVLATNQAAPGAAEGTAVTSL